MSNDKNWGGYREGGGRPATDRNVAVTVRISQEAADKLKTVKNKSEFIDRIIKENVTPPMVGSLGTALNSKVTEVFKVEK